MFDEFLVQGLCEKHDSLVDDFNGINVQYFNLPQQHGYRDPSRGT